MKKILVTLIFVAVAVASAKAQTFEAYKKQQQKQFSNFRKISDKEISKLKEEYKEFLARQNKEFGEYLEKEWQSYRSFQGLEPPKEAPKPEETPVYKRPETEESIEKIEARGVLSVDVDRLESNDLAPRQNYAIEEKIEGKQVVFDYYDQSLNLIVNPKLFLDEPGTLDEKTIRTYWDQISNDENDYAFLISQLNEYRYKLNLNDWGYFMLLKKTSQKLAGIGENTSKLMTWALMNLSGYKCRVAYLDNKCYLTVPVLQTLYGVSFLKFNDLNYYLLDCSNEEVYTFDEEYPGAKKVMDMNLYRPLNLHGKSLTLKVDNPVIKNAEIKLNKSVLDFYDDYPRVEIPVYFNAPLSNDTKNAIANLLEPKLQEKSESEKLAFLLNFVQNAFCYKTDDDQFGKERFFFPDEVFYYPYSDCEDRSVLFAYLVRRFVGFDVIGLKYPGHIATAVCMKEEFPGDYVVYNDKDYVICDPTYLNAPVGACMPEFESVMPQIIPVLNKYSDLEIVDNLWGKLGNAGGVKTSKQDICTDLEGNIFLAGCFSDKMHLEDQEISSSDGSQDVFLACFQPSGKLKWLKDLGGKPTDFCNGLTIDDQERLFVLGNSTESSGAKDQSTIFVQAYDKNGNTLWDFQNPIDGDYQSGTIEKNLKLSYSGKLISDDYHVSDIFSDSYGIFALSENLVVKLGYNASIGLRHEDLSFETGSSYRMDTDQQLNDIKKERDKLAGLNIEPYTVGLVAVLQMLKYNGAFLTGETAIRAIKLYRPDLEEKCPDVLVNLKRIDYFENRNGIISMKMKTGGQISFDKLYLNDQSSMKVTELAPNKTRLDFTNGVKVGNRLIKFNLNYIVIEHPSGDMLFDYDTDHSKATANLKKDVLEM